ncbi:MULTISPECIES: hypothetical protein [unclassified Mannheimia]|uniref:hypothetical protein n=1 Tax=unclassified Mannheimia TaxID=2645054 RepID=UPI00359F0A1B
MYKQFLKSILLATVATFSLSTVVSAKPIPKNLGANQIFEGLVVDRIYTQKDINAALKKEQPNVMGFEAYHQWSGYQRGDKDSSIDKSYFYAKKAAAKNDVLGKFTLGMLYVEGHKQKNGLGKVESKQEGLQLVKQACLDGNVGEKYLYAFDIMNVCSFVLKEYKK